MLQSKRLSDREATAIPCVCIRSRTVKITTSACNAVYTLFTIHAFDRRTDISLIAIRPPGIDAARYKVKNACDEYIWLAHTAS